ncbi:FecR family protein [Pseudomonas sp. ABC1]|uniref:FecR domain-containing protein n=1 Tax=Pseudomonas sp. ABC1 TaxID=2748080 RepID=UPI0015C404F3|nr:FecR family protein [Pseudomonas sp. ABC1]QLF95038.1 FecR family protein [Pseudomonas sp. ABC1]
MVLLRSGSADAETLAGLETWLAASPAHAEAWQHLQQRLGSPYDTLRRHGQGEDARAVLLRPHTSRRNLLQALAGVGLVGGGLWLAAGSRPGQALLADYSSATGERRNVTLTDGSRLFLNAASAVDVDFTPRQRLLHLRHGELVVQAAADPARPLRVLTAEGETRALGTRFLVRQEAGATRVVVLQHAVHISNTSGQALELRQDHAALLRPGSIETLPEQNYRADWLQGRLSVLDETLESVIASLRPYRHGLIRVDPRVRPLRVQGVFPLDDSDRTLLALAETLPIRIEHYGPWITLISPRA